MTQRESSEPWTIKSVLAWASEDFRSRGIESPRLDAELLLGHALGLSRIQLITDAARPLSPSELAAFKALVIRRRAYEPVAYVLGEREFFGRRFVVNEHVLVPRPDTETLVEVALDRSQSCGLSMRALDLCTGSGCVATSLAKERPTASVIGTDVSAKALEVARHNAIRLGAYNVGFFQGDLYRALPDADARFDLITANPPYIPDAEIAALAADIRDHEPHLALRGGKDGLDIVRQIVEGAPGVLAPGGVLALEIGAGQADAVAAILGQAGFSDLRKTRDLGGIERVVSGLSSPAT